MYNLPVCVLNNVASVPNSEYQSQSDKYYPTQIQPCQYMSDMANVPIGAITSYFRDKIQKQAADWLSAAGGSDDWFYGKQRQGNI